MGQQGKPLTLEAMKALVHSIDSWHWERHREKSRSNKNKPDSHKPDSGKSDEKGKNLTSGNNNPNNSKKNKGNQNNGNKSGKLQSSSGNSASLPEKLGKDGKLTPQERQCRFDNNLCMFCGGVGHTAKDCPKSSLSASKAKGHAAQAKEKESTTDSKKG